MNVKTVRPTAPSKTDLLTVFSGYPVANDLLPRGRIAAVAIIFWTDGDHLRLCIGRRAVRIGDPWSGDMAFPGGKSEPSDRTLHDVAARETYEEVGLTLSAEMLIGRLGKMIARAGGRKPPLAVYPLIYLFNTPPAPFLLDNELDAAYWVPVQHLWNRANWISFDYSRTRQRYSGIRVADHFVWGFTLRMMIALAETLGHPLTALLNPSELPYYEG